MIEVVALVIISSIFFKVSWSLDTIWSTQIRLVLMRRFFEVRDQEGCIRFFLGAMMGHLQEIYPYERHVMKINNNKFYIQFPLDHAPRMRT